VAVACSGGGGCAVVVLVWGGQRRYSVAAAHNAPRAAIPEAVNDALMSAPRASQTRYSLKYRHTDGKVILKVTNDRVVSAPHSSRPACRARA